MDQPAAPHPDPTRHTVLEDAYGLITGTMVMGLGLVLMKVGGIVTAGVAGLALLASYTLALPVGLLFFVFNIPFLVLGFGVLGRAFLLRTVMACAMIFLFAGITERATTIAAVHPAFAALVGGTACGMGILAILRHNTGVGGINIVVLWLQRRLGWNVGRLHMVLDGAILLLAGLVIEPVQLAWSALSIVAANLVLIAFHKPGRYTGH